MDLKNKMVRLSDLSPRCLVRSLLRDGWMIAACAAIFCASADGGKGDSLVLSFMYCISFGCSPGVYGVRFFKLLVSTNR